MRIALISDIHGNAFALDAVLTDIQAQAVDQIVCLGDAIQGGAQPAATVRRLRELGCPVVMGNADAWLLTGKETGNEGVTPAQEVVRQWSLAQLTEEDRAFIAAFAPTVTIPLTERDTLLCFHGSPANFDDIILPTTTLDTVRQYMQGYDATWFAGGHTHLQQLRRLGTGVFCNPGSVGVAYNYEQTAEQAHLDPWAEYAIVTATPDAVSVDFRRVALEMTQFLAILRQSGRPGVEKLISEYGD